MDQDTLRRIQQVLQSIIEDGFARVAFLLNHNGRLIAHVGQAHCFHPQARFAEPVEGEEGENVYLTGVEERFVLGAVFSEDVPMELIRERVESIRPTLETVLAPYIPRS